MQVEKLPVKWFCANLKLAKKHPQYIWLIWLPEQLLHWISLQTQVRNSHQNIQKQQPGLHYSGFWIPIQNIQCSRCCITPLLLANICNSWTWGVNTNSTHRRPKISIVFFQRLWKQLGQITTAAFPDRSTRENSVELYHENTAVAVCRTVVLQLTATRASVSQGISVSRCSACAWMPNTELKVDCHAQSFPVLNWRLNRIQNIW